MMNKIFSIILLAAIVCAVCCGNTNELSEALLESGSDAISLCLTLMGGMCVWGGLLKIAERSGAMEWLSRLFSPLVRLLFRGIRKDGKALPLITMNLAANALGLGNAATPMGLAAMRALQEEDQAGDTASNRMIMLTVLNTASLTLFPSTVLTLRMQYDAAAPMEILPAVWLGSTLVLLLLVTLTKLLNAGLRA